jgi:hypothetical protein
MCSQVLFTGQCEIEDWGTGRHLATLEYDPVIETFVSVPWTDPALQELVAEAAKRQRVGG